MDFENSVKAAGAQTFTERVSIIPEYSLVLAFGDSYISGEGLGWWVNEQCHRSVFSWPYLAAARLAFNNPHSLVALSSLACSGANSKNLTSKAKEWKDWLNPRKLPPQIDAAKEALCHRESKRYLKMKKTALNCRPIIPDVVLISIRGNDAEFSR